MLKLGLNSVFLFHHGLQSELEAMQIFCIVICYFFARLSLEALAFWMLLGLTTVS